MLISILIAAAALLGVAVGFAVTWWTTPDEHKFRHILQDFFRDVRDIFRLNALFAFASRAGNVAFGAVMAFATVVATTPELKTAVLNSGPAGWLAYSLILAAVTLQMKKGEAPAQRSAIEDYKELAGVNPHGGPYDPAPFARAEYART